MMQLDYKYETNKSRPPNGLYYHNEKNEVSHVTHVAFLRNSYTITNTKGGSND